MPAYANLSGGSGVTTYQCGPDSITVGFRNGSLYLYTHTRPGRDVVEHMKTLAAAGRGLSTYISQANPSYAAKLR